MGTSQPRPRRPPPAAGALSGQHASICLTCDKRVLPACRRSASVVRSGALSAFLAGFGHVLATLDNCHPTCLDRPCQGPVPVEDQSQGLVPQVPSPKSQGQVSTTQGQVSRTQGLCQGLSLGNFSLRDQEAPAVPAPGRPLPLPSAWRDGPHRVRASGRRQKTHDEPSPAVVPVPSQSSSGRGPAPVSPVHPSTIGVAQPGPGWSSPQGWRVNASEEPKGGWRRRSRRRRRSGQLGWQFRSPAPAAGPSIVGSGSLEAPPGSAPRCVPVKKVPGGVLVTQIKPSLTVIPKGLVGELLPHKDRDRRLGTTQCDLFALPDRGPQPLRSPIRIAVGTGGRNQMCC